MWADCSACEPHTVLTPAVVNSWLTEGTGSQSVYCVEGCVLPIKTCWLLVRHASITLLLMTRSAVSSQLYEPSKPTVNRCVLPIVVTVIGSTSELLSTLDLLRKLSICSVSAGLQLHKMRVPSLRLRVSSVCLLITNVPCKHGWTDRIWYGLKPCIRWGSKERAQVMPGRAQTWLWSIYSTLFGRRQQQCSHWLPVL